VHVLGDATFCAPAMPKSGHMANQHAKVAAAAIVQLLKGEAVNATAGGDEHLLQLRHRDATWCTWPSVHQYDDKDKTFKTVPGSGGVSAAADPAGGPLRAELGQRRGPIPGGWLPPCRLPAAGARGRASARRPA
jgi:sulfite dehydrogenase